MKERNKEGFLQAYDNQRIKEIQFYNDGNCKILFRDNTVRIHQIKCDAVYSSQFGVPLSDDGRLMFVSSWEKGLIAFDTYTGEIQWQYNTPRIRNVLVNKYYVVAIKYREKLIQFDMQSGCILKEINSGTIEGLFQLQSDYALICRIKGKVCAVNITSMDIIKSFSSREVNPLDCLSSTITSADMVHGEIIISGFEKYPHRDISAAATLNFQRSLGML